MSYSASVVGGVGDEVLYVFGSLGLAVLIYIIWSTTFVEERFEVSVVPNSEEEEQPEEREEEVVQEGPEVEVPEGESVTIRVKFLNDTIREVRSALTESVGVFKRKHFSEEVSQNQLVRLVFNGRILEGEGRTLAQCGVFDNCVIHALIQTNPSSSQSSTASPSSAAEGNAAHLNLPQEDLDLSTVCYPLLGSFLSLIWWCQIVYGQYFNLASTLSLISITGLYIFCLTGQFY